ncbi:pentraxin fusion protein-like [Oncorhynchus kisutch]|uniref:pentraxin fusion protein-like n=1 Tax=Oncorhynchus kisutch TaxID=8019 RepID=UPI0009A09B34|nr:pentraxin fusion protein-like [Oncorhynchus kisutch]
MAGQGAPNSVFFITITNRIDCCSRRLNGAEIRIGDSVEDNNDVLWSLLSQSTFHCNGMEGQYINVVIPGRNEYLTLCEVDSYGAPLD